jgi:hypothetical protein
MNVPRKFAFFASVSLAAVVFVGGCKSNNSANTPAASQSAQPAQQPDASQPAAPTGSASTASSQPQATQPAAPVAAPASSQQSAASAPPPPPLPPAAVDLPEGTELPVRLDSDLGSAISHAGDAFSATISDNVRANGQVVIPRGARAEGLIVDAKSLGHFKGGAMLAVKIERVHTRWGSYPVESSSISRAEKGKGKRSAGFIGGGAGLGALIGGIAGGGKGAAIGALAGGGAGTAGAAFTGNKEIVLPAETLLTFRLEHSVHIVEQGAEEPQLQQR